VAKVVRLSGNDLRQCKVLKSEHMCFGFTGRKDKLEVITLSCCGFPWNHPKYQPLIKICPQLWYNITNKGRKFINEQELIDIYCENGLDGFLGLLKERGHRVLVENRGQWAPALYLKLK
jgi:hypothetical protein